MKKHENQDFKLVFGIDELKTVADVKKIISIDAIDVLEKEKDKFSYLGFRCGCFWDQEHGLRVTMHKDKVISVDDDSSYYAYYEILKDKMSEDEWKTYSDIQQKTKEENLAKYHEEREEILAKELEQKEKIYAEDYKEIEEVAANEKVENKKWWKFW